uniref:Leucine-rich repeat-containing protein 57 n=1 Tax=Timema tahoe TaxID=61484 RepID=A0A7R9IKX2_9NEOP|nr:unnamed protein product [Timema tahoe]
MGNSGLKQHLETAKKTGVLKISEGKLSEFPSDFKQLEPLLRTLDLSNNKFTSLPNDIGSYKLLKHLNVSQNKLVSLPEMLGNLSKLESLSACSNKLTCVPQSLSQLVHLKQVYLSHNLITEFPTVFCGLKHLDVLDLSRNKITHVPNRVSELNVTELNLNQNQISSISDMISRCPRLKTLRLEENCLQLSAIHSSILADSKVSILALDGNLFDKKNLADTEGFDKYMDSLPIISNAKMKLKIMMKQLMNKFQQNTQIPEDQENDEDDIPKQLRALHAQVKRRVMPIIHSATHKTSRKATPRDMSEERALKL